MQKLLFTLAWSFFFAIQLVASLVQASDFSDGFNAYEKKDYVEAFEKFTKSSLEENDLRAVFFLSHMYLNGLGVRKDESKAFQLTEVLANSGDTHIVSVQSQFKLAVMYDNGVGTEENKFLAKKWYKRSADNGSNDGKFIYGMLLRLDASKEEGISEKKRINESAFRYISSSVENGKSDADALFALAELYELGIGVHVDFHNAVKYYKLSSLKGNHQSDFRLGLAYFLGNGVERDYKEAFNRFELASKSGIADAQFQLGSMYMSGKGVAKDNIRAYMWLNVAASNGNQFGKVSLDLLEKLMSFTDIERAQKLTSACIKSGYQKCN